MRKKKILYVITKSAWGGAQRYVFDLATNLPKEKFEVVVATGGMGPLVQKLNKAGITTLPIPHLERDIHPLKEIISLWSLYKMFKKERPDVIHLNSSKVGGLGAVAAKLASFVSGRKSSVVFTVHGWGFNESRSLLQKKVIIFLSRLAAIFQNHLIHVSRSDLASTITLDIAAPEKCEYIPLGISQPSFIPHEKARLVFIKKFGIDRDAKIIGTVAELTKNKGLVHLIDAVNQVKTQNPKSKIQTVIVGEGEEREKLQKKINSLGLENTVHLAGFMPDAARYFKAFDLFVLPSLKEGLPYTILEAMRAEIPVVTTNVGGIPDVIEHGIDGSLIPPGNSAELAVTLKILLANTAAKRNLKKNGARRIRNIFLFAGMLRKTVALYES